MEEEEEEMELMSMVLVVGMALWLLTAEAVRQQERLHL